MGAVTILQKAEADTGGVPWPVTEPGLPLWGPGFQSPEALPLKVTPPLSQDGRTSGKARSRSYYGRGWRGADSAPPGECRLHVATTEDGIWRPPPTAQAVMRLWVQPEAGPNRVFWKDDTVAILKQPKSSATGRRVHDPFA